VTRSRHRHHANPFTVRGALTPLDLAAVFHRQAPLALDVGFGRGAFLVELARRHPEWNVLGIELREFLVAKAKAQARALDLTNLHAVIANANAHLSALVPDRSLAFVAINFPDPWFKRRHQKRRVVTRQWLEALATKLMPGAQIHAMTDYEPLARVLLEVFEANPGYCNLAGPGRFAQESTTGILTEREIKHQGRGQPIWRLHYLYRASS
jgi:tRNA (guanine-N7-)-methyltransferase